MQFSRDWNREVTGIYFSQNIDLPLKQKNKIIVMNIYSVPPRELLNKKILEKLENIFLNVVGVRKFTQFLDKNESIEEHPRMNI